MFTIFVWENTCRLYSHITQVPTTHIQVTGDRCGVLPVTAYLYGSVKLSTLAGKRPTFRLTNSCITSLEYKVVNVPFYPNVTAFVYISVSNKVIDHCMISVSGVECPLERPS